MAQHDPSLVGFADYFSAADATSSVVMPAMEEGAPELFGLHADMELLGMRGQLAAHSHSKALIDAGGGGADGGSATMRFLGDDSAQQHPSQQPLSLSLCRPDGAAGMSLHQQHHHLGLGSGSSSRHHHQQQQAAWMMHDYSAVQQQQQQQTWHLRSSRFLVPAQQLLQDFCCLPVDTTTNKQRGANKTAKPSSSSSQEQQQHEEVGGGDGSSASASAQIQAMEAVELQRLKDKLYIMLEEVDRRYRRYCEQMRSLAGGFEAVAGERAAAAYTALASRTISRHFRNLRDGIVAQLQAVRKALGEKDVSVPGMTRGETPRLRVLDQCIRQQKALNQAGLMETHPWRPQRGLPERAVTILRAWLFEHFLHPYPSDVDKHILARQTGLSRSQVSNWFINARVRLWKPMVEEMYVEEMKGEQQQDNAGGGGGGGQHLINPSNNPSSSSQASAEAYNNGVRHNHGVAGDQHADHNGINHPNNNGGNIIDRKPTREQLVLHDAGSLASIVNVGRAGPGGGFMDHLDFDAYNGGHHHQAAAGFGGVSLTLGLQQQHADSSSRDGGGVNIAFGAPSASSASGHHQHAGYGSGLFAAGHHQMEFGGGAAMDGGEVAAAHGGQEHYRSLQSAAGFHLLRDLAG